MRGEELLDAMEHLDEDLVEEADQPPAAKKSVPFQKILTAAACLAVVAAAVALWPVNLGSNTETSGVGHEEGMTFLSYAGPLFPLSVLEGGDDLAAERTLTMDFSLAERAEEVSVTDTYLLENTSSSDKAVTAVYPLAGDFTLSKWPEITVNGTEVDWTLTAGDYIGTFSGVGDGAFTSINLEEFCSWEGYDDLLKDGSYLQSAFSDAPTLDTPVVVYTVSDITGKEDAKGDLFLSFTRDAGKTTVFTYGFNSSGFDSEAGTEYRGISFNEALRLKNKSERYLIAVGEDLQNLQIGAGTPEGTNATVTREEMTIGEVLEKIARLTYSTYTQGRAFIRSISDHISFSTYNQALCRYFAIHSPLGTSPKERYANGVLDDMVQEIVGIQRIFYLCFSLEIPASSTVEVEITVDKDGSFDFDCFGGENAGVYGYDLVTELGSDLTFTKQSAAIEGYDEIEIVRQNFGFDLEQGITKVALDPQVPHYWLEVRRRPS